MTDKNSEPAKEKKREMPLWVAFWIFLVGGNLALLCIVPSLFLFIWPVYNVIVFIVNYHCSWNVKNEQFGALVRIVLWAEGLLAVYMILGGLLLGYVD